MCVGPGRRAGLKNSRGVPVWYVCVWADPALVCEESQSRLFASKEDNNRTGPHVHTASTCTCACTCTCSEGLAPPSTPPVSGRPALLGPPARLKHARPSSGVSSSHTERGRGSRVSRAVPPRSTAGVRELAPCWRMHSWHTRQLVKPEHIKQPYGIAYARRKAADGGSVLVDRPLWRLSFIHSDCVFRCQMCSPMSL